MSDIEIQEQVVEACQALGARGFGNIIGGHLSIRVPGEEAYWTHIIPYAFEEITPADTVKMDFAGNVLHANAQISPGIDFHYGIYKLRPDVNAIVHTHSQAVMTQSAFARAPKMWHTISTYFLDTVAVSPDDTIEAIAPVLKNNIAIIIPWHGAITVGGSIGQAAGLHALFDQACRFDIDLSPSGAEPMPRESCERIQALMQKANYVDYTWELMKRKAAPQTRASEQLRSFRVA